MAIASCHAIKSAIKDSAVECGFRRHLTQGIGVLSEVEARDARTKVARLITAAVVQLPKTPNDAQKNTVDFAPAKVIEEEYYTLSLKGLLLYSLPQAYLIKLNLYCEN